MSAPYPKHTRADAHSTTPSMQPQDYCSLPWCGKAPGGPNKVRVVDGERITYPALIDAHHPFGRPGPVVFICHECHGKHHDGRERLEWEHGGTWFVRRQMKRPRGYEWSCWDQAVTGERWDH